MSKSAPFVHNSIHCTYTTCFMSSPVPCLYCHVPHIYGKAGLSWCVFWGNTVLDDFPSVVGRGAVWRWWSARCSLELVQCSIVMVQCCSTLGSSSKEGRGCRISSSSGQSCHLPFGWKPEPNPSGCALHCRVQAAASQCTHTTVRWRP